jgi:hypothetical protein
MRGSCMSVAVSVNAVATPDSFVHHKAPPPKRRIFLQRIYGTGLAPAAPASSQVPVVVASVGSWCLVSRAVSSIASPSAFSRSSVT